MTLKPARPFGRVHAPVWRIFDPTRKGGWVIAVVSIVIWFAIALSVVVTGFRVPNFGTGLPSTIIVAFGIPFGALAVLWRTSHAFRDWILGIDLVVLTLVQCWRTLGAVFLVLWGFDILPASISRNGGVGDVLTGIFAAFAAVGLLYRPNFATSRLYLAFHLFGIADFVVAVGSGVVAVSASAAEGSSAPSILPLVQYPLFIIPLFLVPFFTFCHVLALLKVRAMKRGEAWL